MNTTTPSAKVGGAKMPSIFLYAFVFSSISLLFNIERSDTSTNRMTEALNLFKEITNNPIFSKTTTILFLNKRDLFELKIKEIRIKSIPDFKDFPGERQNYVEGVLYFTKKFVAQVLDQRFVAENNKFLLFISIATD